MSCNKRSQLFEAAFGEGSASSRNLRSVSGVLGRMFTKIGEEEKDAKIKFRGDKGSLAAEAPIKVTDNDL